MLAILLPPRVDSAAGEEQLALGSVAGGARRRRAPVPAPVVFALRCNMGLRLLSGFLTMFMAFLLREEPFPGWEDRPELLLGLVIGAAGFGSTVGIALGSLLRTVKPEVTVVVTLLADAVMAVVVAAFYGLPTAVLLGAHRGAVAVAGQALPRRADPARGARADPDQRVRPLGDRCCSWPGWSAGSSAS